MIKIITDINVRIDYNNEYLLKQIQLLPSDIIKQLPSYVQCIHKLLNEKVNLLKLHFDYIEKGIGFEEAKKDFIRRMVKK